MTKIEFLAKIRKGLGDFTEEEVQKYFEFYREMIDDRMEDGLTEDEAVAAAGDPNEIIRNILEESRPKKQEKIPENQPTPSKNEEKKSSGLSALAVILIILGSPLWLSLLLAAISIVIAIFAVIFSVIIALYAVVLALGVSALALFAVAFTGSFVRGIFFFGAALTCAGLTVLSLFAVNFIVKLLFIICKGLFNGIKSLFIRRRTNEIG